VKFGKEALVRILKSRLVLLWVVIVVVGSSANVRAQEIDIQNTRSFHGGPIDKNTVGSLQLQWEFLTAPDTGTITPGFGSVSSTPTVEGGFLYFNDISGNITKLNRFTGQLVWKKNYVNDLSVPGSVVTASRNTPLIMHDLVIVGSNFGLIDQLCEVVGKSPAAGVCATGSGAIVLALNKNTGAVVWRKRVEDHRSSKITGSISGHGDRIFVPVGSWEEDWSRAYPNIFTQPIVPGSKYPCCSSRGSLLAMDVNTGEIIWKRHMVIGDDPDHELTPELRALLTPKGFFGTSTYGHNPTLDLERRQIYIATAQTETAPRVAELCEQARRSTGDRTANINGLPAGVTCTNLNEKLKSYANAMLAIDMDTGRVKWVFYARLYDSWNHACGAPDFYGWSTAEPIVFPVGIANTANCDQDPVGPDMGFGHMPTLVKNVRTPDGLRRDLVVAGNKDGRLFALDPDTGKKIWETNVDPGGIYGGLQFGRATDGKRIYFGTTNTRNNGRDIHRAFVPAETFLDVNGFTALGIRVGKFEKRDAATPLSHPSPSDLVLPFPGPNLVFGINDYPNSYPDPDGTGAPAPFLKGPASGPSELWTLVNPPADISADGINVFASGGQLKTIAGMVSAVDAATGKIVWQRPVIDGIKGTLSQAQAFGTLTVGNGVVFIGYADQRGTMVALDADTGRKLFEFHQKVKLADGSEVASGSIESGPAVAGRWVYWGAGAETASLFPDKTLQFRHRGNRVFAFRLPGGDDDPADPDAEKDEGIHSQNTGQALVSPK
jgi:polyvinyl alcohol dehydrogenase (cytochrome)